MQEHDNVNVALLDVHYAYLDHCVCHVTQLAKATAICCYSQLGSFRNKLSTSTPK